MRERNLSIDMFRGITMLLMVFVNEFWKVLNVPHWLEHFATLEDGMGLSDIVFPMFLFAMGMSVPYALERRQAKGYSTGSTLRHILGRTLALLVMGMAFHVDWIVSKNLGTLPWCLFVSAISVALYTLLRRLEKKGWTGWFKPLTPAGTATLTVYMIPYLFIVLWQVVNPIIAPWLTGWVGVGKCALMAAVYIACAWGLTNAGIQLKI